MIKAEIDREILCFESREYVPLLDMLLSFFPIYFVACVYRCIEHENEHGQVYNFHEKLSPNV